MAEGKHLLLLTLGGGSFLDFDGLDDTDSNSLAHITDSETSQRREGLEGLDTHGLLRDHLDHGGVTILDHLGAFFQHLTGTAIHLVLDLRELAGNVGSMAIQHWGVTSMDLTRVIQDNDLSVEGSGFLGGFVLGIRSDVSTADILDGDILDVEANIVTGQSFGQRFVMHFDGLALSGDIGGSEVDTGMNRTIHISFTGVSPSIPELFRTFQLCSRIPYYHTKTGSGSTSSIFKIPNDTLPIEPKSAPNCKSNVEYSS
jgi:hypothetical protein